MVGLSIVKGIRPFISVILMGMLVDAAYAGVEFSGMLRYIAAGVGGIFLMAAADGKVDMAIGNAVGSVTANTALIMAVAMLGMKIVSARRATGSSLRCSSRRRPPSTSSACPGS